MFALHLKLETMKGYLFLGSFLVSVNDRLCQ